MPGKIPATLENRHGERLDHVFTPGRPGGRDLVIVAHGVTSSHDRPYLVQLCDGLAAAGLASLRFSFAGNGESDGAFGECTITKEVEDLGSVLDALGDWNVSYVGHSMGSAVGVLRARSDERIGALVSLAGMVHVARFMERHFGGLVPGQDGMLGREQCPLTQGFLDDAERIGSVLPAAGDLRIPWLLVHGTDDEFVPALESVEMHAASGERAELVMLEGADHRFSGRHEDLVRIIVTWFSSRIVPAVLLLSFMFLCGCGSEPAPENHPDVVLFVVDTLRADRLSCYGYERETSPNIDRLASEGVFCEDATAQASFTRVSMASMMTGRYMTSYRTEFEPEVPTLAETFRDAGYRTIGITGNHLLAARDGFDRGFDHYDNGAEYKGKAMHSRTLDELARDLWPVLDRALVPEGSGKRPPIFLYVHVMDPHAPYFPHDAYRQTLPVREARALAPAGWHEESIAARATPPAEDDPDWRKSWKQIQLGRGRYDHEVRYTDEQLGLLLERFAELGLLENGVVALAADHGEGLWDRISNPHSEDERPPNKFFHQQHGSYLYRELVGTPLLFWGANVPAGVRVSNAVENVDLFPTLVELAGLETPNTLHGLSLVPLMHAPDPDWLKDVHASTIKNVSLREAATGMKLVLPTAHGVERGVKPALYDLHADPGERQNLYDAQPDDVARLRARIEAWRARYPVVTSSGRKQKQATVDGLKALGYADHVEEDETNETSSESD